MIEVDTLTTAEELREHADAWDRLVEGASRPSPFLLEPWLGAWWRELADGAELALHVARADGELVGALPLVVRRRVGLRVAELPGAKQFPLGDALLHPAAPPGTLPALVGLARASHDYADLYATPAEGVLASSGVRGVQRLEAPVLSLERGWEAIYRAKVSSAHRSVDRRKRKRLAELGELAVRVARSPGELAPALEECFRVHDLRWAGRGDGSSFTTTRGRRFHRSAVGALAGRGVPRIVTLELDGRAIAFNLGLVIAGRFCSYRIGFDPALRRHSPGYLNNLDAIEGACEEGLVAFEFLGGAEPHKQQLADRAAPLVDLVGLPGSAAGRGAAAVALAVLEARVRLRRSPRARAAAERVRSLARRRP